MENLCPKCGKPAVLRCRCRLAHAKCENDHEWRIEDGKKVMVSPDDPHRLGPVTIAAVAEHEEDVPDKIRFKGAVYKRAEISSEFRRALINWVAGNVGRSDEARTTLYGLFQKELPGKYVYSGDLYRVVKMERDDSYTGIGRYISDQVLPDWTGLNGNEGIVSFSSSMKGIEDIMRRYRMENAIVFKTKGKGFDVGAALKKEVGKGHYNPGFLREQEIISKAKNLENKIMTIFLDGMDYTNSAKDRKRMARELGIE